METTPLPPPVAGLHDAVTAEASRYATAHSKLWPDLQLDTVGAMAAFGRAIELLTDDRALITSYLHAVADPRPNLSAIAAAQGVSPSTLRHRYSAEQAQAAAKLAHSAREFDQILAPFESFNDNHLLHASPETGYPEIWELRESLRLAFFRFADRMESPGRVYEDDRIYQLCYRAGWSYDKAAQFLESNYDNDTHVGLTIESATLKALRSKSPDNGHSGAYRRLISDYPRGMMEEALLSEPRSLRLFYHEQIL